MELWGGEQQGQSPVHRKSRPYFPFAKVRWLHLLIPEPLFFAAYLQLGNPQELQAREAVCQEPPALVGIFIFIIYFFFMRDFWFSCCFVFKPLGCLLASGSLLESKLEKSSWNSPEKQKGFCAGGFGGRGCFHCCYLHFYFLLVKEHLPVALEEVGCCPCMGGHTDRRTDVS